MDDSNYHPFYITDSISGGRLLNTQQQRAVSNKDLQIILFSHLKNLAI